MYTASAGPSLRTLFIIRTIVRVPVKSITYICMYIFNEFVEFFPPRLFFNARFSVPIAAVARVARAPGPRLYYVNATRFWNKYQIFFYHIHFNFYYIFFFTWETCLDSDINISTHHRDWTRAVRGRLKLCGPSRRYAHTTVADPEIRSGEGVLHFFLRDYRWICLIFVHYFVLSV